MKKTVKKILALCMAVVMLMGMTTTALATEGTTVNLEYMGGDIGVSLSNVVGTDSKKYTQYETEPAYICNSPAEIKTHSEVESFWVNKLELVDGVWTPVKEMPVSGIYRIKYWDESETDHREQESHTGENTIDFKDLDNFERDHPHYFIVRRLEEGAKVTLTEKGVYSVGTSNYGHSLDGFNIVIVTGDGTAPATVQAKPTASSVLVNSKQTAFDAYNIGGNNYFKLRDIAYALNGSDKQFEVKWDGVNNAILLLSDESYTPAGNEMQSKGGVAKTATPTDSKILLDGTEITLTAYNISDNNYFKLRDIGEAFDFGVKWDGAKNAISIDTAAGYFE